MGIIIYLFVPIIGYIKEPGEVTEWLKVLAWKASVPLDRAPRVRIPVSPRFINDN
jgi:hypothetical protein